MTEKRRRRGAGRGPYRVLFEDAHLLVADKDAGILTVPIAGKVSPNLKDLLDEYLVSQKREALPVHRIDRYTSGLVVFAKHRKAWERLVAQFRARTPERVYLALVRGDVPCEAATLRDRLELTTDGFRQRVVRKGGTEAVTHFRVVERLAAATLLEIRLETGLKNQIRVQFRNFGHPLVGDRHYAEEEAAEVHLQRQALHAFRLGFLHPATDKPVSFEAPLPLDFVKLLRRLRWRSPSPTESELVQDQGLPDTSYSTAVATSPSKTTATHRKRTSRSSASAAAPRLTGNRPRTKK